MVHDVAFALFFKQDGYDYIFVLEISIICLGKTDTAVGISFDEANRGGWCLKSLKDFCIVGS